MSDKRYTVRLTDTFEHLTWEQADHMMVHHIEHGGKVDWEEENDTGTAEAALHDLRSLAWAFDEDDDTHRRILAAVEVLEGLAAHERFGGPSASSPTLDR